MDRGQGLQLGFKTYAMPAGATDYVGMLRQAKAQGAKYVVIQNVSSPAAQVAKDIAAQGLDMRIVCLNWCADELFIELAGPAAEGAPAVQPFAPAARHAKPGHQAIARLLPEQGRRPRRKEGLHYVQGWYTMRVDGQGHRETRSPTDEDLTGATIRAALETMGAVDTGGVIGSGRVLRRRRTGARPARASTGSRAASEPMTRAWLRKA